jgi:hypothetical protein
VNRPSRSFHAAGAALNISSHDEKASVMNDIDRITQLVLHERQGRDRG